MNLHRALCNNCQTVHVPGPYLYIATSLTLSKWAATLGFLAFKVGSATCYRQRLTALNKGFRAPAESCKPHDKGELLSEPCLNVKDWQAAHVWAFKTRAKANREEKTLKGLGSPFLNLKNELDHGRMSLDWSLPNTMNGEGEVYLLDASDPMAVGFESIERGTKGLLPPPFVIAVEGELVRQHPYLRIGIDEDGDPAGEQADAEEPCDDHRLYIEELQSLQDEAFLSKEAGWPYDDS